MNERDQLTSALEEFGEAKWKEGYLHAAESLPDSKARLETLVRQNAEMKQKIAHADRLLRYAQRTFGKDGQFDSWFDKTVEKIIYDGDAARQLEARDNQLAKWEIPA